MKNVDDDMSGKQKSAPESRVFVENFMDILGCFGCRLCAEISSPICLSVCCNQFLGCEACVMRWVESVGTCPHCRDENIHTNVRVFNCFNNMLVNLR